MSDQELNLVPMSSRPSKRRLSALDALDTLYKRSMHARMVVGLVHLFYVMDSWTIRICAHNHYYAFDGDVVQLPDGCVVVADTECNVYAVDTLIKDPVTPVPSGYGAVYPTKAFAMSTTNASAKLALKVFDVSGNFMLYSAHRGATLSVVDMSSGAIYESGWRDVVHACFGHDGTIYFVHRGSTTVCAAIFTGSQFSEVVCTCVYPGDEVCPDGMCFERIYGQLFVTFNACQLVRVLNSDLEFAYNFNTSFHGHMTAARLDTSRQLSPRLIVRGKNHESTTRAHVGYYEVYSSNGTTATKVQEFCHTRTNRTKPENQIKPGGFSITDKGQVVTVYNHTLDVRDTSLCIRSAFMCAALLDASYDSPQPS